MSLLDRSHSVAPAHYDRWRVPPSALAIHLAIGQAYAFSVFNLPLSRLLGGASSAPEDWSISQIGWVFSTAIVALGLSAALFGGWLERVGPRKAMATAAVCFASGFFVGAAGIATHQFWLLLLGYGALGGVGLGIGYISPVSTLLKWFPDRPGMATGMAIMGFGGGAMIASPLSVALMAYFRSAASSGVAESFIALGVVYLALMLFGAFTVRIPPAGWSPPGVTERVRALGAPPVVTMTAREAVRTSQFWLLWVMLCTNVTAGIGVLGQASAMIQETFPGRVGVEAAAGFVGILSLANLTGRFLWSSLSDHIGRRATYLIFFALGTLLYAAIPTIGRSGGVALFVTAFVLVLTMYGGGFATIPAYLRDLFGTQEVGAIHGRLLTAWSTAGIIGPVLVNYVREYRIAAGVPKSDAYGVTMYVMAGLLLVGLTAAWRLRPIATTRALHVGSSAGEQVA